MIKKTDYTQKLTDSLLEIGIEATSEQINKLLDYLHILKKWNRAYNLTSIRDIKAMIEKHIIDCASIIKHLSLNKNVLDIGTGAGLPGLVIAVLRPDTKVTVLDSSNKKICFIRQVISDLEITNVSPLCSRIENLTDVRFDYIVSRAFASLGKLYMLSYKLCKDKIIAMKGSISEHEIQEIAHAKYQIIKTHSTENCLHRHIVIITPEES